MKATLLKASIILGGAILGARRYGSVVKIPLKTLNRHGLIAGATEQVKPKLFKSL
jgi:hypothetical protein